MCRRLSYPNKTGMLRNVNMKHLKCKKTGMIYPSVVNKKVYLWSHLLKKDLKMLCTQL